MTKVYLSRAITGVIALLFDLQCSALVVRAWVYIQDLGSRFVGRGGRPNGLRRGSGSCRVCGLLLITHFAELAGVGCTRCYGCVSCHNSLSPPCSFSLSPSS